ncbi:MAG TPA: DUF4129 domain-containing protein [Polyangiaceae bacterium]|nr:DUF4129 domain-containing protein [Polyangiaceae bacterium]
MRRLALALAAAAMLSATPAFADSPPLGRTGTLAVGRSTPYEVQEEVREILGEDAYAFCHDPDYPLEDAARDYCPLLEDPSIECPRFKDACANQKHPDLEGGVPSGRGIGGSGSVGGEGDAKSRGARDDLGRTARRQSQHSGGSGDGDGSGSGSGDRSGHDGNGSGNGDGDASKSGSGSEHGDTKSPDQSADKKPEEKKDEPPPPPEEDRKIEIPGFVALLFKFLFFAVVAAIVAYVVYLIVKNVMKGRDKDEPADETEKKPTDAGEPVAAVPRGPIETDVDRLLNRARAAAQRGDYKQAIDDTYAALLRRLEGDGMVDLHPSRTNGDYVRSLRERPDMKRAVRAIADDVETAQFGADAATPALFDSVWRKVMPLVGRAATVAALVFAAWSLSACGTAYAADALAVGGHGAPGTGPMERGAVERFLEKHELKIERRRDDKSVELEDKKAILLLPDVSIDDKVWRRLLDFAKNDGGTVIVVGHRDFLARDLSIGFGMSTNGYEVLPSTDGPAALYGYRLVLPAAGALTTSPGNQVRPLLSRGGEVYAAERRYPGGGRVVVFADDALFTNVALATGDNAAWLAAWAKQLGVERIEMWDAFTGAGAGTPFESVANAHLTPIVAQLLVLVLLFMIYKGVRFGTPRDPKEASRRAFADHARALGATYARAKASRHAAGLYALWALDRLRERLQRTGRRGLTPLAETLASRTGRPIGDVMRVLVEATGARDEVAPPSSFRPSDFSQLGPRGAAAPSAPDDFAIMRELDTFIASTRGNVASSATPKGGKPTRPQHEDRETP